MHFKDLNMNLSLHFQHKQLGLLDPGPRYNHFHKQSFTSWSTCVAAINTYLRYRELVIVRYNQWTRGEPVGHSAWGIVPIQLIFALVLNPSLR